MLKIGIVGIGGISQKAYLPYMRQLSEIEWHISTRNSQVRKEVASLFGTANEYESVQELAKVNLDGVFIHVATKAHQEMASIFLSNGIPVYMDKPLTEDYESTKALYDLAAKNKTFLMAGFNRRFAPYVKTLSTVSTPCKITVEKNDVNRPGDFTFKLFDFFIHPLDTALFLAQDTLIDGQFAYQLNDAGQLVQIQVNLKTDKTFINVGMNLQSGSRREIMEVQSTSGTYIVENLDHYKMIEGTTETVQHFGSWDTTLNKRGFENIIDAFIDGVKNGVNPVNVESSLLSHWICNQIRESKTQSGFLKVDLPQ